MLKKQSLPAWDAVMMRPGERQVAPTIEGIRKDHTARYAWAAKRIPKASRVIDLACGIGYGTNILASAGHHVTGLDKDAEAISYGWDHYRHRRAMLRQADAEKLGDIGQYDVAVTFETIEHIADPAPLLKSLRKSAPMLIASVPNESVFPWQNHAYHHRHYTRNQFEDLLAATGWRVIEWFGQEGSESEVEPDIDGRTLIAVCERCKPRKIKRPPEHVAILGLGPSVAQYLDYAKRLGSRARIADEVWAINALGNVFACDRIFHMDDVRIQEIRAEASPDSNIAAMLGWLKKHPGPVYTSRVHADYPGLVPFPLADVINSTGHAYLNNTAAYAVAYAIHIGVKKISLYGCDFTYPNSHDAEKGRGCVEFWLGYAAARGIQIAIPRQSSLMDALVADGTRLYGYDTLKVSVKKGKTGRYKVTFKPRESLPTAEEIEANYDHSAHPNALVTK